MSGGGGNEWPEWGTPELLIRAADAAGRAAATIGERSTIPDTIENDGCWRKDIETVLVAGASFDHWRAIEAMFRSMLGEHGSERDDEYPDHGEYCRTCHPLLVLSPCPSLQVLRPLAEQVLRDLTE